MLDLLLLVFSFRRLLKVSSEKFRVGVEKISLDSEWCLLWADQENDKDRMRLAFQYQYQILSHIDGITNRHENPLGVWLLPFNSAMVRNLDFRV